MKFGKQIQRRQLDIPEYAASFFNYKALKKLIKQLSVTPTIPASVASSSNSADPQAALRANKEVFFFRLEREIEKVNVFYLQKEEEFSLRLKTLLDKQRVFQSRRNASNTKAPAKLVTLFEGFQQFDGDLNKLQQFVEINETAVSKILKKWDKTSKSRTKELYLQRAVEVQPCFNRDVLRDLSDRATTARLELEGSAEGESVQVDVNRLPDRPAIPEEDDDDLQILHSSSSGNIAPLREWIAKLHLATDARDRLTRLFLAAIHESPDEVLVLLLDSGLVDIYAEDDINERNCLHEAAICGRSLILEAGLKREVDLSRVDVYGRIPLHYACIHGWVDMVRMLLDAGTSTIDYLDHDNFTPLIHSIIKNHLSCVEQLLSRAARIDPASDSDHVPLNLACQHASLPIIRTLLERNAKFLPDAEGLYPQHLVARSCRSPEVISLLKSHGADLDQKDKLYQWTPLFHAASEGCVECLRTLLDSGVDVGALDEKNLPAMYYAAWEGHLECMALLWSKSTVSSLSHTPLDILNGQKARELSPLSAEETKPDDAQEADGIPDLSLPPPIIPIRRYGHNFLDTKTFVQIVFTSSDPIVFYQTGHHAAARLTISSKTSDLIPRTVILPFQEESRMISFQIDSLDSFALDFEIFPTFGSKVIAKAVALPDVFLAEDRASGSCCLPLFDPRLRAMGEMRFNFQVIKPYYGDPLEITHFATYWKATSARDPEHNGQVTGSSLSGDYVQLFVQITRDRVPVLYPTFTVNHHGIDVPVSQLTFHQIESVGLRRLPTVGSNGAASNSSLLDSLGAMSIDDLAHVHRLLVTSFLPLKDVLRHLPTNVNIDLCILYPTSKDENELGLGPLANINVFADAILTDIFDHARASRESSPDFMRSIVLTSYNPNICIALNWKQPNYPVLLCNDLGQSWNLSAPGVDDIQPTSVKCNGRTSMSIKESARIAQGNNLMGLICRFRLLNVMPALVNSIKGLGLVLVADTSEEPSGKAVPSAMTVTTPAPASSAAAYCMPAGINGVMRGSGVLRFNDTINM